MQDLKKASWKDIAELVGIAAIIASLIFVGVQIQQDEQASTSDYVSNYSGRAGLVSELILNNSEAWSKACAGDDLTEGERMIASQIYVRYYMHSYLTWLLMRVGLNQVKLKTTHQPNGLPKAYGDMRGFAGCLTNILQSQKNPIWYKDFLIRDLVNSTAQLNL